MKEDKNITITRAVACLMIPLVHVGEQWYYDSSVYSGIFNLSVFAIVIGRVAVPVFFMISGFLLFSKNNYIEFDFKIVKTRFLAIFSPLVFFTGIYYVYSLFMGYSANPFNNPYFSHSISHLWYLGYILPVYTLSPFINIPKFENKKQYLALLGIVLFFFFVTESIMSAPYSFAANYSFNQALLYMFTGYLLKQFSFPKKRQTVMFALIFIYLIYISYLLLLYAKDFDLLVKYSGNKYIEEILNVVQYILGGQDQILSSYKTLAVFLQAVSLFLFFQSLNLSGMSDDIYNKVSYIARRSLKIYGWHMIFILFIAELMLPWNKFLLFFLSFVLSIWGSLVFVYLEDLFNDFIKYKKI